MAISNWQLASALPHWNLLGADCQVLCCNKKPPTMNLNGIKLTWLGHATFRIETPAGKTIIVDPWVMGNPKCPDAEKNVKKVDVLLCTHGHFDHIGDAVEIAKKHNPVVVAIPELAHWLGKKGVRASCGNEQGWHPDRWRHQGHHGARRPLLRHHGWRSDRVRRRGLWLRDRVFQRSEDLSCRRHQRVRRYGNHSRPLCAADCHDSDWRPLHHVAARSRVCLQPA